jgi:hypothetical protein
MEDNMRGTGNMISEMGKALKDIPMVIVTLGSSNLEELTEKECILGVMERFMMVSGIKVWNRVTVFGEVLKMIHTSESGRILKLMDMVFIHGPTGIDMKDNGICASSMVKAQTHSLMVTAIMANTRMENLMAKENIPGPKVNNMSANSNREKNKVTDVGSLRRTKLIAISMKVSIWMTLSMEKESILGQAVISIRVSIMRMSAMEMAKCSGPIAVCMKVNG